MAETIQYTPPTTIKKFIRDKRDHELFYSWIAGPVGSGKTTGIFMKLVYMAGLQAKSPDGVRRTKAVIVRNTNQQLKDTTLASWNYWFKDGQAGTWRETDKKFTLRFGDIECEVLFRPLDTEADVQRVLSLEVTFALIDEFVEIPRKIIEALSARCGRYPSKIDGGATNWGMWGSSNPSTEDNWWYAYLHKQCDDPNQNLPPNAVYFKQPSGMSDEAENLENLPGERNYYISQMAGKSEAWIKQFVDSEWGFSASGKAVVSSIKQNLHFVKGLILNPNLPLVAGLDPGLGGSAFIFGQMDLEGRLNVLGELVQVGYGSERLMSERLRPYLRFRWPVLSLENFIIAPDPAAGNRTQNDEKSVVDKLKRHFRCEIETNNRLPLRLDAIDHVATTLTPSGPALRIDEKMCPVLTRALRGGWRYRLDQKRDVIAGIEPEKNAYSHPGDGFGYLCRYFHKITEREQRYGVGGPRIQKRFTPPSAYSTTYHQR
jgi:hypothetical protein